jgi:hypothetical protein
MAQKYMELAAIWDGKSAVTAGLEADWQRISGNAPTAEADDEETEPSPIADDTLYYDERKPPPMLVFALGATTSAPAILPLPAVPARKRTPEGELLHLFWCKEWPSFRRGHTGPGDR